MRPVSCSACVPRMATAIASSHMRMRPRLPMFTTSETAPMVQKLVRFAPAPKTKPRANPPHATHAPRFAVPLNGIPYGKQEAILAKLVARGIGEARALEALAPEAAGIAAAAGPAAGVGVVARHREREIDAELVPLAHDLFLAHRDD